MFQVTLDEFKDMSFEMLIKLFNSISDGVHRFYIPPDSAAVGVSWKVLQRHLSKSLNNNCKCAIMRQSSLKHNGSMIPTEDIKKKIQLN